LKRAIHASESINRMLIYHSVFSIMIQTIILFVSFVHTFACLFYLCAKYEGYENSWVGYLGWDYLTPNQLYIVSIYFVMTTILTIGFGDMTPQTSSETIFLNKIKKNCRNIKQLIVIHNLINCHTKRDIEKYKKEILLNNIIIKFDERVIPNFKKNGDKDKFNKYYVEFEENNKDNQSDVLHFILGNDSEEEIKYYNESTINFIQDYIDVKINEDINIIDNLTEHINNLSSLVLNKPIKAKVNENYDLIKYEGDIEPKEIIADELDNITFIGNYYEPAYKCYKKDEKFIVAIDICSQIKEGSLKVIHKSDKENNELEIFRIKGERLICGKDKSGNKTNKIDLTNKRINAKKFQLNFKINLQEKGIVSIGAEYTHSIQKGILLISFDIYN